MKALKVLSKVFQSLAAVLFVVSIVVGCALSEDNQTDQTYITLILTQIGLVACALVGILLTWAKGDTAKKVGHGLALAAYAMGLAFSVWMLTYEDDDTSIGAVLMIVAVAMLAAYYLCKLIGVIMNKGLPYVEDPSQDSRIIRIKEWKHLMEEGIISEEEYEEKRVKILGIKSKPEKADSSAK
ncbi:MAG: SHOCT domain-containing protein [Clostridia bacterium]|nr:SHOCT domain-containing protein [Clostridia bacterium]